MCVWVAPLRAVVVFVGVVPLMISTMCSEPIVASFFLKKDAESFGTRVNTELEA